MAGGELMRTVGIAFVAAVRLAGRHAEHPRGGCS
jgi:hypothetical protein